MIQPPYRTYEHTADIAVEVLGKTLPDLFKNAAYAMRDLCWMAGKKPSQPSEAQMIVLEGGSYEELLVGWLNEFIYIFETRHLLPCEFEVYHLEEGKLVAKVWLIPYKEEEHEILNNIKAVTYHQLRIEKGRKGFQVRVIFDV